jgi:dTDP-glucose 4,6-dehydratase
VTTDKVRRLLGWKPAITFEQGLPGTIAWYREHRGWWERIKSGEFREYYRRMYDHRATAEGRR